MVYQVGFLCNRELYYKYSIETRQNLPNMTINHMVSINTIINVNYKSTSKSEKLKQIELVSNIPHNSLFLEYIL